MGSREMRDPQVEGGTGKPKTGVEKGLCIPEGHRAILRRLESRVWVMEVTEHFLCEGGT